MRITEKQKETISSLVVERLRDNHAEYASLANTFSNKKNPTLEHIITSRTAFDRDRENTTAYYAVKAPTGELLLYFSLKCGELFEDLDVRKMNLAAKTQQAIAVLTGTDSPQKEDAEKAEAFLEENAEDIKFLLPEIENYIAKKEQYAADIQQELNKQMRRVLKTYPAVEIVEFCANDNAREAWRSLGLHRKMGECIFWHHIVPRLLAIQDIAGCQYVYLFAADSTPDSILVNYYKVALKFEQLAGLGANKPRYDFQCTFLCQKMSELAEKQDFFYEHFNTDAEDDLV
ncbi:MAG: hypothetical protein K2O17_03825 [Bacteroidaceae bacterium]|nr:hypothetical protein [Bacteroidaceae bacterium]